MTSRSTSTEAPRYVSRGGLKLENGLLALGVDPAGRRCLDVGRLDGRVHRLPAAARRRGGRGAGRGLRRSFTGGCARIRG